MGDGDLRTRLKLCPSPGGVFDLAGVDPASTPMVASRRVAERELGGHLGKRLADYQDVLSANQSTSVLVVLQGLDASGKSGTIKHVFSGMNPAAVRVASFKPPSREEERHHFLWRIRKQLPDPGELVVFDRSHYEDLVVPLASGEIDPVALNKRVREVNRFEQESVASSTVVIKCFLHISYDEQRERFLRRLKRDDKRWKFNEDDLDTRDRWSVFLASYGSVLATTSTADAPWFVIPADHKWFRNWAVARIIADSLADLGLNYPQRDIDVAAMMERLDSA